MAAGGLGCGRRELNLLHAHVQQLRGLPCLAKATCQGKCPHGLVLQCVPAHRLLEQTSVASVAEVQAQHAQRLKDNKHLRYMWLPHTDSVVVVTCNEVPQVGAP